MNRNDDSRGTTIEDRLSHIDQSTAEKFDKLNSTLKTFMLSMQRQRHPLTSFKGAEVLEEVDPNNPILQIPMILPPMITHGDS